MGKYMNRPEILLQGICVREGICLYKALYMNARRRSTHNNQIMKITQMCINREMDKQIVIYLCHGILLSSKKNKLLIHITAYMNFKILRLSENSQTRESTILYTIIYIKF